MALVLGKKACLLAGQPAKAMARPPFWPGAVGVTTAVIPKAEKALSRM
jgi:hypothetical protein